MTRTRTLIAVPIKNTERQGAAREVNEEIDRDATASKLGSV